MNNEVTVFDRFPRLLPTAFENDIPSSIFDEFERLFDTSKFRHMSVYPVNIYEKRIDDVLDSMVIEIATAGISRDKCKVKVDGNKLFVNIRIF